MLSLWCAAYGRASGRSCESCGPSWQESSPTAKKRPPSPPSQQSVRNNNSKIGGPIRTSRTKCRVHNREQELGPFGGPKEDDTNASDLVRALQLLQNIYSPEDFSKYEKVLIPPKAEKAKRREEALLENVHTQERLEKQEMGYCEQINKLGHNLEQQRLMLQEVRTRLQVVRDEVSASRALVADPTEPTGQRLSRRPFRQPAIHRLLEMRLIGALFVVFSRRKWTSNLKTCRLNKRMKTWVREVNGSLFQGQEAERFGGHDKAWLRRKGRKGSPNHFPSSWRQSAWKKMKKFQAWMLRVRLGRCRKGSSKKLQTMRHWSQCGSCSTERKKKTKKKVRYQQ